MSTFIRRLTAVSPARNGMSSLLHGICQAGASLALAFASLALMLQGPVIALLVIFALGTGLLGRACRPGDDETFPATESCRARPWVDALNGETLATLGMASASTLMVLCLLH
ncbi:hypothetical protein C8E00_102587 [Chromohalobacter marismortui]|uniref:Uncharacterized protein n=1 Tax=Chromohalobacter marismortui TaxID=42055 RepID=A0A4R7NSR8_9GAMM|nr:MULTISPECIES: hypothetical protein [Chromohalobacter]MCI0509027.1 hypothetical protein [Chromohalobacter sp.]MCI0592868.1 hypothetical protein [Chromohalobacter sp.]TDU24083.1 hypothetical protein C8E00_102587 [Chromohalobacter marismortui]